MRKISHKIITAVILSLLAVGIISVFESVFILSYWPKSMIKASCFIAAITIYCLIYKEDVIKLLNVKKKLPSKKLLISMTFVYVGIIAAYLILKDRIDLSGIRENLLRKEGLTKDNFIFIFSYIIFVNSFLEESFFRGFIYNVFKDQGFRIVGIIYGSLLFSIYHLGIVALWFDPLILIVCTVGLALAGAFLQFICIKEDNLLASFIVHGCANLAINTIGVLMLFQS